MEVFANRKSLIEFMNFPNFTSMDYTHRFGFFSHYLTNTENQG